MKSVRALEDRKLNKRLTRLVETTGLSKAIEHDDEPSGLPLVSLHARLREAAAWCSTRLEKGPPHEVLRTKDFQPGVLDRSRFETLASICLERQRQLSSTVSGTTDLPQGRLLLFYPDATLSDGAADAETNGYFDEDNIPPWDTWVAYFEESRSDVSFGAYILCWVPRALVELVDGGIEVNPEECIQWLTASKTELSVILSKSGITS